MRRFILILTAALLAASSGQATTWWKTYGGEGKDYGHCVQETSDGNYIITGVTDGQTWLFKIDTLGNILWEKIDQGGGSWLEETPDGGFILAGDPDLLKTDSKGDSLWASDYGIVAMCVQETSDGSYIVTGNRRINDLPHLVLLKADSQGNILWMRTYEMEGWTWSEGYFVQQTSDSGYIITGVIVDTLYNLDSDISVSSSHADETDERWLWLVKTDAQGDIQWTRRYGEQNDPLRFYNKGRCVRQTNDGGYVITGQRDIGEFWVLKTNSDGDTLWTHTYGGGGGYNVQETLEGDYIITGEGPAVGWSSSSSPTGGDLLLLKLNPEGETLWTRSYGGGATDIGYCVQQTQDKGYIITGYTMSFGAGDRDLYLLKTDSLGLLAIAEDSLNEVNSSWVVSSNFGSQMILRYWDMPQGFQASVFDVTGRKIARIHALGSSGSVTWGINQVPGVYFIQVKETNQTRTEKVEIIR